MSAPARRFAPAWLQWLRLGLGVLGFAGALGMLVVVVAGQGWRLDLTPGQRFSLSERARKVLRTLDREVRVVAFVRSDDSRNAEIEDLLRRAAQATPRLHFEVVDLNRNPALARQYGIGAFASFVVESDGRRRNFTNPREELLIEAILQVTGQSQRLAYFTSGHGEGDLRSDDRRGGYSQLRASLQSELLEWRLLDLSTGTGVPRDADVVVVLGLHQDWSLSELLSLRAYLENGGRLLLLVDPGSFPSLRGFLAGYGVELEEGVVVDSQARMFAGDRLTFVVPGILRSAPIAATLQSAPLVSGVAAMKLGSPQARVANAVEFLQSAPSSWLARVADPAAAAADGFVGGRDQRGPLTVAMSVELAAAGERSGRIVVIGDSDFAGNALFDYLGNKDLFLNAMNWLTGSNELIGVRAQGQVAGVNQLFITEEQGWRLFVLAAVVEPGVFLALGVGVYVRRRWWV